MREVRREKRRKEGRKVKVLLIFSDFFVIYSIFAFCVCLNWYACMCVCMCVSV